MSERLIEAAARAMWERRRRHARADRPDLPDLEPWGDGSIPRANGVMEEARAALVAIEAMGYRFVPQFPTAAMFNAGREIALEQRPANPEAVYAAMLDAVVLP